MRTIFILSFFSFYIGVSQETLLISKKEVLEKVYQENNSLQITKKEYLMAKADFNQTKAVFLPNITASHTGILTTNPLQAFGSKLNQAVVTQQDFDPARLNNPSETRNFATLIEIQQPLVNVDGVFKRKALKAKMKAMELSASRAKDVIKLEVEKAYMQLQLAHKSVAVFKQALLTAEANKKAAQNNYTEGYIQQADVLKVEIHVAEMKNQLQTAKSNVLNASNYLALLMNSKQNVIYQPSEQLLVSMDEHSNAKVSEERADIKAMALSAEAYKKMYQSEKMGFLPRLNAFGSYQLFDDSVFNATASGYIVGAQLQWDVFKGSKRISQVQKSKAEYEKSVLELAQYTSKSKFELHTVIRKLADTKNKLNVTELAVEQAKEALRIRKNRFKEGLEKPADVLSAETQYVQKQLEYYQTVFEHNYSNAYAQFLTKQ